MRALTPMAVAKVPGFVPALQLGVSARAGLWLSSGSVCVCVCASAAPTPAFGSALALRTERGRGWGRAPTGRAPRAEEPGPLSAGESPRAGTSGAPGDTSLCRGGLSGPAEQKQRLCCRGSIAGAVEVGNAVTETCRCNGPGRNRDTATSVGLNAYVTKGLVPAGKCTSLVFHGFGLYAVRETGPFCIWQVECILMLRPFTVRQTLSLPGVRGSVVTARILSRVTIQCVLAVCWYHVIRVGSVILPLHSWNLLIS